MFGKITDEQRREVLVRLGWEPAASRRLSGRALADALNAAWSRNPERVEFEAMRQLGKAFDYSEICDLPTQ